MRSITPIVAAAVLLLTACSEGGDTRSLNAAPAPVDGAVETRDAAAELLALTDTYMAELVREQPYLQMMSGMRVTALPDNSVAGAQKMANTAKALLDKLATIDPATLSHDGQMTYAMFKGQLEQAVEGERFFWHKFNVTPYAVGITFSTVVPATLANAPLASEEDIDLYLALLQDVGRYLDDDLTRLKGQEKRGILLPKAALPGAHTAISGIGQTIASVTAMDENRLANLEESQRTRLREGIALAVNDRIKPALDALLAYQGSDYATRAPEAVGLGQYPDGDAAYRFFIRKETTMDLDPAEIHRRGLAYMAEIQAGMAAIRDELGFEGSQQAFHDRMRADPRLFAKTPEEVAARYMGYIKRIEPHIPDYFAVLPKATYGVKRLDAAAEPGMTFGFYQAPTPSDPRGYYRFNGSKLESRPMVWTGALIYHELVPGHHFHIALQRENENFSEFRKQTGMMYAAFTEGWANYAASLANEMGIMEDPYDRYGWLLFNAFITNRLVVDTGMNYQGWSLERAREYMMENTFSSEEEVATETLRYATDLPAQSLAYKLGLEKIREIRKAEEARLGEDFDIKKFHTATVGSGAMPLPLLEQHVDWFMQQ